MSKEIIEITRGQMIEHLTRSMFDDIEMNLEKLEDFIMYGFNGYENYHTDELIKEYQEYINPENPDKVGIELIKEDI